ncbi:MAG: hypothetical protein GF381_03235 [Candidatus Pacebacteria bacterium]|nr:hypothetical protein [Candidatus Paceibacterota bacterium]
MKIFSLVLLFVLLLGQLQRIQLTPFVALYWHDLLLTLFLSWQLAQKETRIKLISQFKTLAKNKVLVWFISWTLTGLLINSLAQGLNIKPWLYIFRLVIYLLFGWTWTRSLSQKKQKSFILSLGLGWSLIGLGQYFLYPDIRSISLAGWDDHYYRLVGTLLDPNFLGIILVMTLLNLQTWIKKPRLNWALTSLLTFSLLLTYSRASYLSFGLMIGIMIISCWLKNKPKKAVSYLALVIIFSLAVPFLPQPGGEGVNLARTATIESRLTTNQQVLEQLKPWQLIVGQGLFWPTVNQQSTAEAIHAQFPDNLLVFIFSATGIIGLILFTEVLIKLIKTISSKNLWAGTIWGAVLVHGMFNHTLFEPFVFLILTLSSWVYSSKETVNS